MNERASGKQREKAGGGGVRGGVGASWTEVLILQKQDESQTKLIVSYFYKINLRQNSSFLTSTMQDDFYKINLRQNLSFLTSAMQEKSETKLIVSDFYKIHLRQK